MNTKHNLVISGIIGGVIGSLLTTLLVSPVTAQKDKFGEIECTALTVVDANGIPLVRLQDGGLGGSFTIFEKLERDVNTLYSSAKKFGDIAVRLGVVGAGPYIEVWGDESLEDKSSAIKVSIRGESPLRGHPSINIHGIGGNTSLYGGALSLSDPDGETGVSLATSKTYGGTVSVHGKVVSRERREFLGTVHPSVHINQYGLGGIEVRDGHDYRLLSEDGDTYGKDD